jgi:DNA polymerase-1
VNDVINIERDSAKVTALGMLYGMSIHGVQKQLNIPFEAANKIVQEFSKSFPLINNFVNEAKRNAKRNGFITTIMGRRRYLPDLNSNDFNKRSAAERQVVNSIIQGSASEITKYAMLCVERELLSSFSDESRPKLIVQIHDELFYELPLQLNPNQSSVGKA